MDSDVRAQFDQKFDDFPPFDRSLLPHPARDAEKLYGHRCILTKVQLCVIDLLVDGDTDSHIAGKLNINRRTIYHWRTFDRNFIVSLHRARTQADRYQTKLLEATDSLYQLLQSSDPHINPRTRHRRHARAKCRSQTTRSR